MATVETGLANETHFAGITATGLRKISVEELRKSLFHCQALKTPYV